MMNVVIVSWDDVVVFVLSLFGMELVKSYGKLVVKVVVNGCSFLVIGYELEILFVVEIDCDIIEVFKVIDFGIFW